MPAGIHHILVEQGTTYEQGFTWKINGNPVNLNGWVARLQARAQRNFDPVVSLTSELVGGITLNSSPGRIEIYMDPYTTSSLIPGVHKYDLELQSPNGKVTRLLKGNFRVSAENTINE